MSVGNLEHGGWPTGGSGGINDDTSTAGQGSKRDSYSHDTAWGGLAGNQHVPTNIVRYTPHLPHSPAGGAPEHVAEFSAGHRWTEAEGKVQMGVGPGNQRS